MRVKFHVRFTFALALLAALSLAPIGAAQVAPARGPAALEAVEEAAERAREVAYQILEEGAPGLSVAVARDGVVVWAEGFGWLDVEAQIPVTPTSRFRVGSVAKSFTAAGLALLVEEGRVDLDVPVQEYVPGFPEKEQGEITLRQLGGHLSGIRHYQGLEFASNTPYATVTESLAIFADDPLRHAPGEAFSYTTYGWTLISAAMETAAEQEFLTLMDGRVFRPLGMNSTVADYADRTLPGRATCYYLRGDEAAEAGAVDNSYKWAGGGFLSTATDLVRFGSAHLEPGFLREETLSLLLTQQHTTAGEPTGYGIGWGIHAQPDSEGGLEFGHSGGSVGGTTALVVHAPSRIAVGLTTNLSRGPVNVARAREIRRIFAEE